MEIELNIARKRLILLWVVGSCIILIIFLIQHLNGKFEDKVGDAWTWVSANTIPFITLVLSSFALEKSRSRITKVDRFYFRLSFGLSLFYLAAVLSIILMVPFSDKPIIDFYKETNIYLISMQSVVCGAIGAFFVKGK